MLPPRALSAITAAVLGCQALAGTPPAGFTETPVATGLTDPTDIAFSPLDGALWICQQDGRVLIKRTGQNPVEAIDIVISPGCERGLLGLAFDPQFTTNHFVYVYYTFAGAPARNRVVRYTESSDTLGSPLVIIDDLFVSGACNHNGGVVQFGADGKLYVGVGENADPPLSQDLTSPLGKVLRVNTDGTAPSDNPFFNQPPRDPRIWLYGLRNPWRLDFDDANGDLYVGDVGANTWEEVELGVIGLNYRWPTCEGTCGAGTGFENPIHQYSTGGGGAIAVGPVYRGSNFPASYTGVLFFADYVQGWVRYLTQDASHNVTGVFDFVTSAQGAVDLEIGPDGCLYYSAYWTGEVLQVCNDNPPPVADFSGNPLSGPAPLAVAFTNLSTNATSYSWAFGDGGTSTAANPSHTYNAAGSYTVTLTATGTGGSDTETKPNYITVTATAPNNLVTGLGPDPASLARVQAFDNVGQPFAGIDFLAYGTGGFGVNVGRGDINGSATDELLSGPGPSGVFGPLVRAFLTPTPSAILKVNFYAYNTLRYGVFAEGGDVDGDGIAEIITTPGPGAVFGPHVRGFNFDGITLGAIAKISFFAFNTLRYGARNFPASIDTDGYAEMIVSPGPSGAFATLVRAFNYDNAAVSSIAKVNFFAYAGLTHGAQVSAGDMDADGIGEILTGPGPSSGNPAQGRGWNYDGVTLQMLTGLDFTAYPGANYGVLVSGGDVDGDGKSEVVTMPAAPALAPNGKGWDYESNTVTAISSLDFVADPAARYGGNVDTGDFGF